MPPAYTCNSPPNGPQFVQNTTKPFAGFAIALRCVAVILGGKKPPFVADTSSAAEGWAATPEELMPTPFWEYTWLFAAVMSTRPAMVKNLFRLFACLLLFILLLI
jgi:hypothetical protein